MACYIPRWYTRPKTVSHPGTNWARRALSSSTNAANHYATPPAEARADYIRGQSLGLGGKRCDVCWVGVVVACEIKRCYHMNCVLFHRYEGQALSGAVLLTTRTLLLRRELAWTSLPCLRSRLRVRTHVSSQYSAHTLNC